LDAKFKSEIALFIESYFKTHPEVFKGERGDKGDPLEVDEEELERLVENCMRRMNRRVNWLGGAEPIRRLPAAAVDFAGNVNTVEDLTGSSGSSLVGFMPSGIGAVTRDLQTKVREVAYSPEDTGAAGTGSPTDDKAEIDQAVTNLASAGGKLEFGSKTYYCNSAPATIPATVNLEGKGPAHHAFYDAGTTAGSVLLIKGSAAGYCLTVGGGASGRGMFGVRDMSIYSSGTAAITGIVKLAGVLHPYWQNVEIAGLDSTNGVGLDLLRDASNNPTIYGTFNHLKIVEVDTGLQIDGDCNKNTFISCSIQGKVRAFWIKATSQTPQGVSFHGGAMEATYSTSMEHEWIAAGTHIYGVGQNTAGVYVVKLGKITGADSTTFDSVYFEIGSVPATYDDGSHGVLSLYPVVEVGTGVTNTKFDNCDWNCYLLDRGTRTRVDGFLTGSDYWTKAPPRSIRRSSAATAVPATTYTPIPFATALEEDSGAFFWDTGNTRLEVLRAGFYRISCQVVLDTWGANSDWAHIRIVAGGTTFYGPNVPHLGTNIQGVTCEVALSLAVGATIKVEAFTGEDTTVLNDASYNRLMVYQC
jgi:hypothetical protein